jgi:hypothetical protein
MAMPAKLTARQAKARAKSPDLPPLVPGQSLLLTLDVSSSAIGWCASTSGDMLDSFGLITPKRSRAAAAERIDSMLLQLDQEVLSSPGLVVMEWSDGKIAGRLGRASGLSVLGAAQGAVRQFLLGKGYVVYLVGENQWTKRVPKPTRAKRIAMWFRAYGEWAAAGVDKGMDVADAIGIAQYVWAKVAERRLIELGSKRP